MFQDGFQIGNVKDDYTMQTFSSKHSVALPKKHTLLSFIAHSAYQRVQHIGVKKTLTDI